MKTRSFYLWFLSSAALTSACSQPEASVVRITSTLSLPDAPDGVTVPLDPADGFPVRVRICAALDAASHPVGSALQAHVWLSQQVGGATVSMGTPATDLPTVTLEPAADGSTADGGAVDGGTLNGGAPGCAGPGYYTAVTTLNAPGPGPVQIQGDVDGQPIPSICAVVAPPLAQLSSCALTGAPPPLIALSDPLPLAEWNGSVPRYSICAETAASKGTVTLTSPDTTLVSAMQTPLTGTLIPGNCGQPQISGGPRVSHVNFDVSGTPPVTSPSPEIPFTVIATLQGMPAVQSTVEDQYTWTAMAVIGANPPVAQLAVTSVTETEVVASGLVFEVTFQATQVAIAGADGSSSQNVEGLAVAFASTTANVAFSPSSNVTDSSGLASSFVLVPFGTQITAVVSGGGNQIKQLVPSVPPDNPPAGLTFLNTPMASAYLPTGILYTVTGVASDPIVTPATSIDGLSLTFTSTTGATFSPSSVTTNSSGQATSNVLVPYGTTTEVVISGGGYVTPPFAITALPVALSITFSPPNIGTTAAAPYTVTVGATTNDGNIQLVGLAISLTITDGEGSGPTIAAPSSILTDAMGNVEYTFYLPNTVTSITAFASGGGAFQSKTLTN
jgi:hypothetical protein